MPKTKGRFNKVIIDPLSKGDSNETDTTFEKASDVFARHGMYLETASKNKDAGILSVKEYLKSENNEASLFFFDDLVYTIKEIEGLMWEVDPNSEKEKAQKGGISLECKYRTIVADPPWPIGNFPAWFCKNKRSKKELEIGMNPTPYKTMTLHDIEQLNVSDIAADGAHLYLWTTDAFMEAALQVSRAWGFEKSATLVWCKEPMGKGLGGMYPSNVEFVLFCRRVENKGWQKFGTWLKERRKEAGLTTGQVCCAIGAHGKANHGGTQSNWENGLGLPNAEQWRRVKIVLGIGSEKDAELDSLRIVPGKRADGRWFKFQRGKHSRKPDGFFDIVEQVSPSPRIELFARRQRDGWSSWGNECRQDVVLSVPPIAAANN